MYDCSCVFFPRICSIYTYLHMHTHHAQKQRILPRKIPKTHMCLYFLMLKSTRAKCPVKAVSKNNTQILELVELAGRFAEQSIQGWGHVFPGLEKRSVTNSNVPRHLIISAQAWQIISGRGTFELAVEPWENVFPGLEKSRAGKTSPGPEKRSATFLFCFFVRKHVETRFSRPGKTLSH